jgi:outer membrane protein OmpA-like peptidoglycan-associated protein
VPVQPPVENTPIRNERQFTVLFDFDSTQITNETFGELGLMADFIQTRQTNDIVLEGHTDSKGSENYNLRLSQDRANVAKDILVNRYGIDSMKLRPIGYGESRPVDTNNTDQGRQNNRRVVATVVSEQ